jgi:hypothetical protein
LKIIVYNSKDQYALSRKQIEKLKDVLPNEYFAPIQEFHVTHSLRGSERFEYNENNKEAHFYFPIVKKSPEIVSEAVRELLLGLSRIKTDTNWGYPLSDIERNKNMDFVNKWHQKCVAALA